MVTLKKNILYTKTAHKACNTYTMENLMMWRPDLAWRKSPNENEENTYICVYGSLQTAKTASVYFGLDSKIKRVTLI